MASNYSGNSEAPDTVAQLKKMLPLLLGVGIPLLALIFWGLSKLGSGSGEEQATTTAAPSAAAPAEEAAPADVSTLLESARTAMREQRLVQPAGNNAIHYYLQVLEAEPENRHAQLAILELMPMAQGVTEQLIETERLDEAQQAAELLRRAQPTSVVVTTLEQRIVGKRREIDQRRLAEEDAQRRAALAAAQPAAPATPEPEPEPPATAAVEPPPAAATAQPVEPAPQPAATVAATTPPPSASPSPQAQSRDFSVSRRVNPTYPQQALRTGTSGWVELSFTITPTGDVTDVQVTNSQPRRVFDREAIRALSQWKFNPRLENGRPVAATARQRLEFNLDAQR